MSFDKETRNLLAKTVTACRRRLTEDVTDQLKGVFGLHPDGTVLALKEMSHLSPDKAAAAGRLRDLFDHYTAGAAGGEKDRRKSAYERMTLEISFTNLNRLAALRLCEERGLVVECVRKGAASAGFQMFERISGGALGGRYDTYRVFLECLFDELALDLGVLFDRTTPQSAVFPSESCLFQKKDSLDGILVALNKPELTHLWTEDETIGWVYQYFNPPEERKAMRDASQAPRNSRELAVRNQFFTPRYVVEFLTDNTLGRIWYEMRKGDTALKDECRYLVRRPNEVFLAAGEKSPPEAEGRTDLSQEDLLKQPVYIEHRPKKDPRDLRILDPACGSGHFLLYTFDLLESIYEEAWLDPELGPLLWGAVGFVPKVDESPSDDAVAPESVSLREDANPACFRCGKPADTFILTDLYQTPWLAGRPMMYCADCMEEMSGAIRLRVPLAAFSYMNAVGSGWFSNMTGTTFLGLAKCFQYRMGGPKEWVFEKLEQAGQDEPLKLLRQAVPKLIIEHNLHGIDIDPRAVQIAALALWLRAQKTWKNLGIKAAERPQVAKSNIVTAEPMPGEADMKEEFTAGLKPRVLGQLVDTVFDKMKLAGEAGSLLKIEEEIKDVVSQAKDQWKEQPKPIQMELFGGSAPAKPVQMELRFDVKEITDERFWEQAGDRILDALREYAERTENGSAIHRRLFAEDAARGFAFIDLCRMRYDMVLMNPPFGEYPANLRDLMKKHFPQGWIDIYCCFILRASSMLSDNGACGCITSRSFMFLRRLSNLRIEMLTNSPRPLIILDLGMGVMDSAAVEACASILNRETNSKTTIYIDGLSEDSKNHILTHGLNSWHSSLAKWIICPHVNFKLLPDSVFVADLPSSIMRLYRSENRLISFAKASPGLTTLDNERFIRLCWEIECGNADWVPFAKGGSGKPFYQETALALFWGENGRQLKARAAMYGGAPSRFIASEENYFRPGLTYPRVGKTFSVRILPRGFIFAEKGISIFLHEKEYSKSNAAYERLLFLSGLLNSRLVSFLVSLNSPGRFWESGSVNRMPIPANTESSLLIELALKGYYTARSIYFQDETSHVFCSPELRSGDLSKAQDALDSILSQCEEEASRIYGVADFNEQKHRWKLCEEDEIEDEENDDKNQETFSQDQHSLLLYVIGCMFGRWDVRIAIAPSLAPKLPDPFDPLPVCPPGMLVGPDGLPAESNSIVSEEWLRARPDVNTLPAEGTVSKPTIPDSEYPLQIAWNGILVDDPGFNGDRPHRDDIVHRVREVLDLLWKEKSHEIEQEACDILGVSDLRDYFRKPSKFFQDHLKRYSKSRRKAPIYWPLATASGSYTIWVYYHRLNDQTLYAAVNNYVELKINEIERGLARIEDDLKAASGGEATRLRDRLNEAQAFLGELRDLREELLRIAALPYKPDLNDGVIINAAPFHGLFRLRSWAKDTEECWKKLAKGDYDWAHLAYTIWPDRVRGVCKKDRSIAIAHGLEELCEVENPASKKKGGRSRRRKENF